MDFWSHQHMISIARQYPIKSQKQAGKHTHKTGKKNKIKQQQQQQQAAATIKVQKTARQKGILSGILEFAFCTHPKEAQHLVHRDSSVHFGITQTLVSPHHLTHSTLNHLWFQTLPSRLPLSQPQATSSQLHYPCQGYSCLYKIHFSHIHWCILYCNFAAFPSYVNLLALLCDRFVCTLYVQLPCLIVFFALSGWQLLLASWCAFI